MQAVTKNWNSLHAITQTKLLIVEDEALFARAVAKRLQKAGYECELAETILDARAIVKQWLPDIALLDMRLPDGNGLDVLSELSTKGISVIVMTAHGDVHDAVQAMKLGAVDFLKKPVDLEELLLVVQKNEQTTKLNHSLDYSRQRNSYAVEGVEMVGDSPAMKTVQTQIKRIAQIVQNENEIPPTVLIIGETGTGKDVAARLLHVSCVHREKPFVHVDCASLPGELIEAELFGHEKGAYTSAIASRPGLIEAAEDGTLFLDEVGELPLGLQAKLLNVLERRMVRRLGSTRERSVPARIIAATNRDLQHMVDEGRFRSDLYYRLNVLSITMPPLRNRGEDILKLAQHFCLQTERRYGLERHHFSKQAHQVLLQYHWLGNVRELRHQISRAVLLSNSNEISAESLNLPVMNRTTRVHDAESYAEATTLNVAEKMMLMNALRTANNNVSEAARQLGITRMTMRYRMDKHGITI